MSSEFPYPSFKCILEYLEANKRIHICSRSKALQKIDKKVPLHIKSLDFGWRSIRVNDIETELRSESYWYNEEEKEKVLVDGVFRNWDQVVMPGDVSMEDGQIYKLSNTKDLEIRNQIPFELKFIRDETEEPRASPNIPYQIALKKVANSLFGGRCLIYVSEIEVLQPVLRLPVGFNIRIRGFLKIGIGNIDSLLTITDPTSFPLKSIMLDPTAPENYYHQIVQTAESLEISSYHSVHFLKPWHEEVLSLPHKHIKLSWARFRCEEMMSVVQDWLDHPRELGRTLAVGCSENTAVERLYEIKKRFNGKVVLISENNDDGIYPKALIIPIDSTSELFISFNDEEEIKLESVPTGKIQSTIKGGLKIHICSRSKALQKIDKKIPLHIKRLEFIGVSITVNDITIIVHWGENFNNREQVLVDGVFRDWNQVIMPGDVCMKDGEYHKLLNTKDLEVRGQTPLELNFYKDKNKARRVPPNIPHSIAMKMVATVLFGGRCSIHVSKLAIQSSMLRLPVGLNFRIRNYVDISANNLNEILRIVDPQSFPLKSISTIPSEPENFHHQIVQTAETLETWPSDIRFFQEPWHRAVLTFPHKHIKLNTNGSVHEEIISIVQDWMDHPRQHGRTLTVLDLKGGLVKRLYDMNKQFHGRLALISGNNNNGVFAKAVIIPIGSTSELLLSSTREEEIKLESIPTGTIQSTIYADLTHPDVMWFYSCRINEYFGESFIETIFFIFAFIIAVGAIFLVFYDF